MEKMYTKDHQWLLFNGDIVTVGLTEYEQHQLGDITYVDLPAIGTKASKGGCLVKLESVKSASDILAPVSGEVTEINGTLKQMPERISQSPEDAGWLFRIRTAETSNPAWMSKSAYERYLRTG